MPRLEAYEQQVTAQPVNAGSVPIESFTGGWKTATETFGVLDETVKQFKKVRDYNEVSGAEQSFTQELDQIKQLAANEQDPTKAAEYKAKIDGIVSKNLQSISDPAIRQQAASKFNLSAYSTFSAINTDFRNKEIEIGQANYIASSFEASNKIANANTPEEAKMAEAMWEDNLQSAVSAGLYDPKEVANLRIQHQKDIISAQKTKALYDIQADTATKEEDSAVLAELRKDDGKYSNFDQKTRLDLIQDAQRRIFQNNQTFKRDSEIARNERFDEIFTKSYNGNLTLSDIDEQMQIPEEYGGIPRKQLIDIKEGIQKRVKSDLAVVVENSDKAAEYLRFIDNFINDENDRQKGREYLATAFKDQILSDKEASFLNSIKREAEDIEYGRKYQESWNPFKGAIKYVGEQMRGRKTATEADAALAIKKLLAGLAEGKDPKVVQKQILTDDAIKRNPAVIGIPEEGMEFMDDSGAIKMVMPDGTWKSPKTQGGQ